MRKIAKKREKEPEPPSRRESAMVQGEWCVYLLLCADKSLYCGATNNLDRRITLHNKGQASRYTRARLPVTLAVSSGPMAKGAALSLEAQVKKLHKDEKISAIKNAE